MTKKPFLLFFLFIICLSACQAPEPPPDSVSIVPVPVSVSLGQGWYAIPETVRISAGNDDEKNTASFLADFIQSWDLQAEIVEGGDAHIRMNSSALTDSSPSGSYEITIDKNGVDLRSGSGAGLFYAAQSLMQLVEPSGDRLKVPHLTLSDAPRFEWRGLHLDVARHFFPVSFVKRYIDLMAQYKFSVFHWHLTEDQGWRIEIKKYPKLQEVAAYRKETVVGHNRDQPRQYDGQRHGGYYTQDEVREVVAYAAKRYITVVPEIEMPGHALAALSAYPELGCTGGPYEAATHWGIFDDVFCAGQEATFEFLQGVVDEVLELFPSEYIHVGGDECPKARWEKCSHCQKRIKDENLKDEHELQSYFIQRMEKYLNERGRKLIGWDEILEGGLAPNATVMSWRGEEGGIAAAKSGHDVVMTPTFALYFDYYQGDPETEPLAIGGNLPLKKVYEYDPSPEALTEEELKYILGTQANVWTEYMKTPEYVEYMVYPRALALAEVAWSPKKSRDWQSFVARLPYQFRYLDRQNVNYRKPAEDELK